MEISCGGLGAMLEEQQPESSAPRDQCAVALTRVLPHLGRILKSSMREGSLTLPQMLMLSAMRDGARPGELARRCMLSSPATTAALDGMVDEELCVRTHSEKDRRTVLVQITPKGEALLTESQARVTAAIRAMLQGWDRESMGQLLAVLQDLNMSADLYLDTATT